MPVSAVTRAGWVMVKHGSKIATRKAAFGSPQASFSPVCESLISAKDCVSLPVPAVVGQPTDGRSGRPVVPRPR